MIAFPSPATIAKIPACHRGKAKFYTGLYGPYLGAIPENQHQRVIKQAAWASIGRFNCTGQRVSRLARGSSWLSPKNSALILGLSPISLLKPYASLSRLWCDLFCRRRRAPAYRKPPIFNVEISSSWLCVVDITTPGYVCNGRFLMNPSA